MSDPARQELLRRWRLILGADANQRKTSEAGTGPPESQLDPLDQKRDEALDYLYRREFSGREGYGPTAGRSSRGGGRGASTLAPVRWLNRVRRLFPRSTVETLQRQAVERYRLTSLLTDSKVLREAEPSIQLVQTLLAYRSALKPSIMDEVRRIIAAVCRELEQALARKVRAAFSSHRQRHAHGGRRMLSNLDFAKTLRHNLKHAHSVDDALILERLFFYRRREDRIPWDIYLVVDQSGSMLDAVIHAAVIASVFAGVRSLRTRLFLFDTQVVEVTGHLTDPVATLLGVQLGGGTDIGGAMTHVADCITQPRRSLLVLVTDFDEGGDESRLFDQTQHLRDAGVTMLGLTALDGDANPYYDERIARQMVALGMDVGSMTPDHLADWVAERVK